MKSQKMPAAFATGIRIHPVCRTRLSGRGLPAVATAATTTVATLATAAAATTVAALAAAAATTVAAFAAATTTAAVAATATAAAATTVTAAATTTTAAAEGGTLLTGTRFIDGQGAAIPFLAVQLVDRGIHGGIGIHRHKSKSARTAAVPVSGEVNIRHGSELGE